MIEHTYIYGSGAQTVNQVLFATYLFRDLLGINYFMTIFHNQAFSRPVLLLWKWLL